MPAAQHPADAVERVAGAPAPVPEGLLLHAAADLVDRVEPELDHMEGVQDAHRAGSWARSAEWSRTGARCQRFGWSVSPARSPNRTCGFHRIRLSTCSCRWVRRRRSSLSRSTAWGWPLRGSGSG